MKNHIAAWLSMALGVLFLGTAQSQGTPEWVTEATAAGLLQQVIERAGSDATKKKGYSECVGRAVAHRLFQDSAALQRWNDVGQRAYYLIASPPVIEPCIRISLDVLHVDAAKYQGRPISVGGVATTGGGFLVVRKTSSDLSFALVDVSSISRDQQLDLLRWCSDARETCMVNVVGVGAGVHNGRPAVKAEQVRVLR